MMKKFALMTVLAAIVSSTVSAPFAAPNGNRVSEPAYFSAATGDGSSASATSTCAAPLVGAQKSHRRDNAADFSRATRSLRCVAVSPFTRGSVTSAAWPQ